MLACLTHTISYASAAEATAAQACPEASRPATVWSPWYIFTYMSSFVAPDLMQASKAALTHVQTSSAGPSMVVPNACTECFKPLAAMTLFVGEGSSRGDGRIRVGRKHYTTSKTYSYRGFNVLEFLLGGSRGHGNHLYIRNQGWCSRHDGSEGR